MIRPERDNLDAYLAVDDVLTSLAPAIVGTLRRSSKRSVLWPHLPERLDG
jgi:hypothetical protein